jgi:hypothetical protein
MEYRSSSHLFTLAVHTELHVMDLTVAETTSEKTTKYIVTTKHSY